MAEATPVTGPAWDLSDEYTSVDDPQLIQDLADLDELLGRVEKLNARMSDPQESLTVAQEVGKLSSACEDLISNVYVFANCLLSVDSQHEGAQKLSGRLQSFQKRMGDLFEPLSQYLETVEEAELVQYLSDPELAPSEFIVRHARKRNHEKLSLSEESLVNGLSRSGIHAWGDLYDQLSGSLQCQVMVGNESQTMGVAQASGLLASPDDRQRQAAWQAINTAWESQDESCAAAINSISGWRLEMCEQRSGTKNVHYLDAPVHMNRIGRATLDTLLQAAFDNKALAQRAAKLQAKAYGKTGFGPWDLRAPAPILAGGTEQPIAFDEAVEIIAEAYGEVDPSMSEFVHMMVNNRWVEGTVGPTKRPGAYCTGFSKSRHPRVYMTYTGGQSDVITLAHELGHALHSWVMRDLPDSQLSYGMSLAETASTFGETLVRDALLARSQSPQEKLDILWEEMSALTAFLLNIPTRFEFEQKFYDARAERPLRPQELKDMMSEAWVSWYGDALAEPDPMFWASKLHFYISGLSFYNFPYLFGYLFSLGVYARKDDFGSDFYARYVALLKDTGRMSAEDLAQKHLGVQLEEPTFWQQTIDSLAERVDAFDNLLTEIGTG